MMPQPIPFPPSTIRLAQSPFVKKSGPSSESLRRVFASLGTFHRSPTGTRKPSGVKNSLPEGK